MAEDTVTGQSEFTLVVLWHVLKAGWKIILACVLLVASLGMAYLSVASVYYQAEVVAAPASDETSSSSSLTSRLGSLGAIAGLSAPLDKDVLINISYLKSRDFTLRFLMARDLVKRLAPSFWDVQSNRWKNDIPNARIQAEERALSIFQKLRNINVERESQLVTISLQWKDAFEGARLLNDMVNSANEELRQRKITETESSIRYLTAEINTTSLAETRRTFSDILESQIQAMMIANSRKQYAFRIIDPAVPSMTVARPQNAIIMLMAILGGFLIGAIAVLMRFYWKVAQRAV